MKPRRIAVFGLGFVGLPFALLCAARGNMVTGVEANESLARSLSKGHTDLLESYHGTPIQEVLREQLASGRFRVTTDPQQALATSEDVVVTVGVPVSGGKPDTSPLEAAARSIAAGLHPGQLVLIRSTVTPGTTRRLVLPILEERGLKAERDFFLAYAPERIAEGRAFEEFEEMPTVVAGVGPESTARARELLSLVTRAEIIEASSLEVAETAKVLENLSRDVDIALVNEFAAFTKELGLDIFEVIRTANTHKRVRLLLPGPGVGGYCVPNAFYYVLPCALELGVELKLARLARQINDEVPRRVAGMVLRCLPVPPAAGKVAVLGIAMKDFSNDDRLSPALAVISHLEEAGVEVRAYDPAVPKQYRFSAATLEEALRGAHGVAVLARQHGIPYHDLALFRQLLAGSRPFIVDTRNIYSRAEVEAAGLHLETL